MMGSCVTRFFVEHFPSPPPPRKWNLRFVYPSIKYQKGKLNTRHLKGSRSDGLLKVDNINLGLVGFTN